VRRANARIVRLARQKMSQIAALAVEEFAGWVTKGCRTAQVAEFASEETTPE